MPVVSHLWRSGEFFVGRLVLAVTQEDVQVVKAVVLVIVHGEVRFAVSVEVAYYGVWTLTHSEAGRRAEAWLEA